MKIAFVTPGYNPQDVNRGSGTFYYLSKEIEKQGWQVQYFGPIISKDPLPTKVLRFLTKNIYKGRYLTYLDPFVAMARGRELARQLSDKNVDLILTNDHGVVAGLETRLPIVLYTDVMLPFKISRTSIKMHYDLKKVPILILKICQTTVKRSLKRAYLCVFPAEWQSVEADRYSISKTRNVIIPFGANIPDPGRELAEQRDFSKNVASKKVDLLFVGKDWKRKGGDTAIKVVNLLRENAIDARLHLVGVKFFDLPDHIISYGLLNKNNQGDWVLLDKLYRESDVFLFPSLSEGSAIVPREAAAYGLPTLAYKIDGVMSSIADGVSGLLLEQGATEEDFVNQIRIWFDNPEKYNHLSKQAREHYENSASWERNCEVLLNSIVDKMPR